MIAVLTKRSITKPHGALCMNWGHPLATGMICCMPFNEGCGVPAADSVPFVQDVAGGAWGQTSGYANTSWVENTPGRGVLLNTSSYIPIVGAHNGTANLTGSMTTGGTVLLIRRKTDTTARAAAFGITVSTAVNYRCSALLPYGGGTVYWDFGGASGDNRLSVSSAATTAVEMWAFTAGRNGMSIYKDGKRIASSSNAIVARATGGVMNLNNTYGDGGDIQEFYFFAVCNVQWGRALISHWFQEPYGMLVPLASSRRASLGLGGDAIARPQVMIIT